MAQYIVSARKYRPDSFGTLIGQDNIAQTLKNSILRGQLAHAYLFCGPRGVGKTTTARIFAKMINCSNPSADMEPCGQCESCLSFAEGRSYCIHELDAASNNSVENIRDIRDEVVYSPAAIHQFYRSKKNGKLYWIGNIIDNPSVIDSNGPRYPLNICQVDEEYGFLIKDSLAVIDGLREGQYEVELSNFNLLEDPDTKDIEIRLTKTNFNGQHQEEGYWYSEAWEYVIHFE